MSTPPVCRTDARGHESGEVAGHAFGMASVPSKAQIRHGAALIDSVERLTRAWLHFFGGDRKTVEHSMMKLTSHRFAITWGAASG